MLLHWLEHIAQAYQVYVMDLPVSESLGVLGWFAPWLVTSETLHFGYALVMLSALILLAPGFGGRARIWWMISLGIQGWHFVEHALLQLQAMLGVDFFGGVVPTSVVQQWVPRVELHLLYNGLVFVPMVVAMVLHAYLPNEPGRECTCGPRPPDHGSALERHHEERLGARR